VIEIGVDFELNFTAVTRTFVCLFHAYNDQSSATAATRRIDWNSNVMPPFAAAHG
jgi:hypothetical protein